MSSTAIDDVERYLREHLPGGQWILPHWQDGPYRIVPVSSTRDAHREALLLLAAFTPLATSFPLYNGFVVETADIYAVPHYVFQTLVWHQEEYGLTLELECVGDGTITYDEPPTEQAILDMLEDLTSVDDGAFAGHRDQLLSAIATLRAAGTDGLRAISVIDADAARQDPYDELDENVFKMLTILTSAAAIVAPTSA